MNSVALVRIINLNSIALVHKQTIPPERPPPVGEVSANFCGYRVSRGQRNGSVAVSLGFLDPVRR
jgi:hypothetical protein